MPESHPLRRSASASELTSMSSTSDNKSPKDVNWLRQTNGDQKKGKELQEVGSSSSTQPSQTDIFRNGALVSHESRENNPVIASSNSVDRDAASDVEQVSRERELVDTSRNNISMGALAPRDSMSSNAERPLTRSDLDQFRQDLERGIGNTVRQELDRQGNRPRTWREWANTDLNTFVSTASVGLGVLGIAAFVYTYRPDLISHH